MLTAPRLLDLKSAARCTLFYCFGGVSTLSIISQERQKFQQTEPRTGSLTPKLNHIEVASSQTRYLGPWKAASTWVEQSKTPMMLDTRQQIESRVWLQMFNMACNVDCDSRLCAPGGGVSFVTSKEMPVRCADDHLEVWAWLRGINDSSFAIDRQSHRREIGAVI
ncbi:hypothetical protein J1614_006231 [Plenodomus biglobosus]|nr:hypothetical protein J1614_006231 [Plenodomus biglobosus]